MDLTTLFIAYLVTLTNDAPADDVVSELMAAYANVRATTASLDDLNTAYLDFLT